MGCGSQKAQTKVLSTENISQKAGELDMSGEAFDLNKLKSALDKQIDEYNLLNFNLPYSEYKSILSGNNYARMFQMLIDMQGEILQQLPRPYQTQDQRQHLITITSDLIDMNLPKHFLNKYLFLSAGYKLYTVEQFSPDEVGVVQRAPILAQARLKKGQDGIITKLSLLDDLQKLSSGAQQSQNPQILSHAIQIVQDGIEEPAAEKFTTTNYKILNILTSEGENDTQSHSQDYYVQYYQRYNSQLGITLSTRRQQLQQYKILAQSAD